MPCSITGSTRASTSVSDDKYDEYNCSAEEREEGDELQKHLERRDGEGEVQGELASKFFISAAFPACEWSWGAYLDCKEELS